MLKILITFFRKKYKTLICPTKDFSNQSFERTKELSHPSFKKSQTLFSKTPKGFCELFANFLRTFCTLFSKKRLAFPFVGVVAAAVGVRVAGAALFGTEFPWIHVFAVVFVLRGAAHAHFLFEGFLAEGRDLKVETVQIRVVIDGVVAVFGSLDPSRKAANVL